MARRPVTKVDLDLVRDWSPDRIKWLRWYMNWSQQEMQFHTLLRQSTVSAWETGRAKPMGGLLMMLELFAQRVGYEVKNPDPYLQMALAEDLLEEACRAFYDYMRAKKQMRWDDLAREEMQEANLVRQKMANVLFKIATEGWTAERIIRYPGLVE